MSTCMGRIVDGERERDSKDDYEDEHEHDYGHDYDYEHEHDYGLSLHPQSIF